MKCIAAGGRRPLVVAGEIDAERHDGHSLGRNFQQTRHHRRVIVADRDEHIDIRHALLNECDNAIAILLRQPFKKKIFALQRAADRPLQRLAQRPGEANQQRVGQVDDVGCRFRADPLEQLLEFAAEDAAFALEHGNRQLPEQLRIGRDRAACKRLNDSR